MADRFAVASGNWLDTAIWNGGTLPASADDVYSNGFTVAVNGSVTVLSIRNTAATGITAGGGFTAVNGFTLTLTGAGVITGGSTCLTSSLTSGQSFTLVGNVTGSTVNTSAGVNNASTGVLNIIGNCTGGSTSSSPGVNNASSGTVNITGNCLGGSFNVTAGSGANNASTGTMNITGDCFGGPASGFSAGATNSSTGTLNITGTCRGSSSINIAGANNASTGTLVHIGIVQATASAPGIIGANVGQVTILTGPLLSSDASFSNATASGVNPCTCARWFPADTALTTFEYRLRGQSLSGSPLIRPARSLYLAESFAAGVQGGYPSETNVRSGTIYGPSNTRTGTCAVPPAGSVSLGVPVDNTTGSAAITADNIRSAVGLNSANLDAQFAAIPSASTIAAAVWSNTTRTLTTAIDNATTIATAVWSNVIRTITGGTVDTLVNAPTVPTASQIATATRQEMDNNSAKLANLNATVTSRMAAADYQAPPSPADNAAAVRANLAPELTRVANCATVETTGAQIAALE